MKPTTLLVAWSFGIITAVTAGELQAQTALGGGNALDSNLGVGTGGLNIPAPVTNFADRNLIITGDVVGGRAFRGFVGYSADSDFRDRLGSNDLFRFRANSAISSPQYFQVGTTYDQLRFGQELGIVEYRPAGSAAPAAINAANPIAVSSSIDRLDIDRRVASAALAMNQQQLVEPRVIGSGYGKDGQLLLFNASPVQGITVEDARMSAGLAGLSTFDALRAREDFQDNKTPYTIGKVFQTDFDRVLKEADSTPKEPDNSIKTTVDAQTVNATIQKDYQKVLQEVADRYAQAKNVDQKFSPELMSELSKSYQTLRDELKGEQKNLNEPLDNIVKPGLNPDRKRGTATGGQEQPATELVEKPKTPDFQLEPPKIGPQGEPNAADFAAILRHGQHIEHLSSATQDRFNEVMGQAEQSLREGDYFMAERRFERALRFVPGHPLAMLGTAHSQLGAGLYLSASLTLRKLFAQQPEMIDVTYAPELLPKPDRLDIAIASIQKRMSDSEVEQDDRASYGFLLAYIGHQTARRDLVETGLKVMHESDPSSVLLPLVHDVWLPDKARNDSEAPQTAPAPADPEK